MSGKYSRTLGACLTAAALFSLSLFPAASSAAALTKAQLTGTLRAQDVFTDRDLRQDYDASGAEYISVTDSGSYLLDSEGVYIFSGSAEEYTITVAAGSEDKVQIVLDGVRVTNTSSPVINVTGSDKVFVTTAEGSENSLSVTGAFTNEGGSKADGVIYSKQDLVLNGTGSLIISSTDNGVVCKDDLKITGGVLSIACAGTALEANDSILMADGAVTVSECGDGLKAENDGDASLGYIVILGGEITVRAGGNGIKAASVARIDGGSITIEAEDGIEGALVLVNGGSVSVTAEDDGIAAAELSSLWETGITLTGGSLRVSISSREGVALKSDGSIALSGGEADITALTAFDYALNGTVNGCILTVNGSPAADLSK